MSVDYRHTGPETFGTVTFVGSLVETRKGVVIRRPKVPKPPKERVFNPTLPTRVIAMIDRGELGIAEVYGDSMQPGILDGDILIHDSRAPRDGDVVCVRAKSDGYQMVARVHGDMILKDNPRFAEWSAPLADYEIEGVVRQRYFRQWRHKGENWKAIHNSRAALESIAKLPHGGVGDDPKEALKDLGFYSDGKLEILRGVLDIPASELLRGRLPWGVFRAQAKHDYPHMGIERGAWLTLGPTGMVKVGDSVVASDGNGTCAVGVLHNEPIGPDQSGRMEYRWWYGSLPGFPSARIEASLSCHAQAVIVATEPANTAAAYVGGAPAKRRAATTTRRSAVAARAGLRAVRNVARATQVSVEIMGRPYTLRSQDGADPDHMAAVGRYVASTLETIKAETTTIDPLKIAILGALNIADQLLRATRNGA